MVKCAVCGKELLMPFKCSYCGEYFCAEHRLPEKHNCPGLYAAASPYEKEVKRRRAVKEEEPPWEHVITPIPRSYRTRHGFFRGEAFQLLIGALLVILVGFSLIGYNFALPPLILGLFVIGFVASFLLHELGHRSYARSRGLYARFKLDPFGALLTLVTAIPLIPFKVIAPGAVVVSGLASIEVFGMTALMGPVINLVLSAGLNIAAYILARFPSGLIPFLLYKLGALNAFIAFFNLIPFGELDGRKVLAWSPGRWVAAFALSLLLLIISAYSI